MRKIREVLRLKFEVGLSARQVAVSLQVGRASVGEYLNRFAASGLTWPSALTDAELQRHLFPPPAVPSDQRPIFDWAWAWAHAKLRRPGVTVALLWQEYRLGHQQGFQYSWLCEHYRLWAAKVDVVMRQELRAGQNVPVFDRQTGEIRQTQIFVAVLGIEYYHA
jgi:transposase